ncbi:hypothetical protein [uncultured Flavobacterium sp.]|uniref:hypothetical protein n=1 Tax=uncultured Flavobacterium sp. TaxID=165435 RepID=UPI0030CA32CB
MTKKYSKHNFHKHTFCVFKEVEMQLILDLKPNYNSKSGSVYYFNEEGLFRVSNHWGRAANCRWKLDYNFLKTQKLSQINYSKSKIGFAKWTDFYPNNEQENLFYIEINIETKIIDFYHKLNPNYDGLAILRNAAETAKRIKICKEIFTETQWAKHLVYESLDSLRMQLIQQLCFTNHSFIALKKKYI